MLITGDQAPLSIKVRDESNQLITLSSAQGSFVILYFYPKNDTPGCTKEACGFRDIYHQLQELGVKVIGISKDSQASHQKFKEKYQLPFELWSDEEHELLEAFGVWGEKSMMGRIFKGITRSTFVLDPTGKIIKAWPKVKPEDHPAEVLAFIKSVI